MQTKPSRTHRQNKKPYGFSLFHPFWKAENPQGFYTFAYQ